MSDSPGPINKPTQLTPYGSSQPVQSKVQEAQPTMDALKPSYDPPHSHLPLAVVTAIICALLNFTSLALGIPAIVLSALAYYSVQRYQWKVAQKYANFGFYMSLAGWIYTLTFAFVALVGFIGALIIIIINVNDFDDDDY